MQRIVLLGLPGAGKGTQGKLLAGHYNLSHVSLGDVVRDHIAHDTPLGRKIRATFHPTEWQPLTDDLAIQVARETIVGLSGFVLDGFPRNAVQAQAGVGEMDAVVFLRASEETCRSRILGRKREGDDVQKFEARLMAERERMPELIDYMRSRYRFLEVDAEEPEEVVFNRIRTTLERRER